MNAAVALLPFNVAVSPALTGLIWTVQLVHYPAFRYIAEKRFTEFGAIHQRRIRLVVGPLMRIEFSSTLAFFAWRVAERTP